MSYQFQLFSAHSKFNESKLCRKFALNTFEGDFRERTQSWSCAEINKLAASAKSSIKLQFNYVERWLYLSFVSYQWQSTTNCHTRKKQLLWTMCVGELQHERHVHFNTIVRDLFSDCLTKFDCDLITAEWPIVSSRKIGNFSGDLKSSFVFCWFCEFPCVNDVIDIETNSDRENRKRSKILSLDVLTFFMKS